MVTLPLHHFEPDSLMPQGAALRFWGRIHPKYLFPANAETAQDWNVMRNTRS